MFQFLKIFLLAAGFIPSFRLDIRHFPLWRGNARNGEKALFCIVFVWLLLRLRCFNSLASAG